MEGVQEMGRWEEHNDVLQVLQVVVVFIFDLLDPESALRNDQSDQLLL